MEKTKTRVQVAQKPAPNLDVLLLTNIFLLQRGDPLQTLTTHCSPK